MILDWHTWWAWVVVVGNGVSGLWCIGAHYWAPLRVRAVWAAVIVVQLSVFVQVALGVYLVAVEDVPAPGMHMLYGFAALFTVAILYAYRAQVRAWQFLLYGFGGLFLMGLGIRAVILG